MNKYFIYCRKSSEQEDRQILSLPAQSAELITLAKENSLVVVDVYKESQSAHKIGRPIFDEMLKRIENGEANGIIAWDESRIARNALDSGRVIYMIDLEKIVEIRKPGKIYKNTPDDKSWLAMCFMMSKKESDDKGVNVKRGLKTKAEKGWLPSSCPKAGYKWDIFTERGNKKIIKDKVRFNLIRKAWDLLLTKRYSVASIWRIMNEEWGYKTLKRKRMGGKPLSRSKLYEIFKDPFYCGQYEYPEGSNQWYEGLHKKMITKQEFELAQAILGKKGFYRKTKKELPFAQVFRCGDCFSAITPDEKNQIICFVCKYKFARTREDVCRKCKTKVEDMESPTYLHYIYYRCIRSKNPACKQKSVELKDLKLQLEELLSKIQISDRFKTWAIKYLNETNQEEISKRKSILSSLQASYNDIERRLSNLLKLKISPDNTEGELLSDEEFVEQKTQLIKEKNSLLTQLKNADINGNKWIEDASSIFDFAVRAKQRFAEGDVSERKDIITYLGSNLYIRDKKVFIELQKPLMFIEELKTKISDISADFEPEEKLDNPIQLEALWAKNQDMLRD